MKAKILLFTLTLLLAIVADALGQPFITITKQPTNQTASLFADATFRVTAAGDAPLSYQWRFNDDDLIGRTNTSLTVTNVQRTNAGNYSVVVTNLSGSLTSQVVTLTITSFNSIYCFGFSWTDTRNCNWPAPQYYQSRACNGPMWPEFLSTNLGLAYIAANNYAHCGASSSDVRDQVIGFPTPSKPQLSLYYVWGGDSEFFRAIPGSANYLPVTNDVAWNQIIQAAILNNSNAVARLYAKGARTIVVSAGEIPANALTSLSTNGGWGLLSSAEQATEIEYEARFHAGFYDAMHTFSQTRPDLRLLSVDVLSKLNDVVANPSPYGFTKTDIDALDDTSLTNKSFTGPGEDYMFWDGAHPTSKLHKLISSWHLEALTNSILEKLDVTITNNSPNIQMNRLLIGRDYTLQSSTNLNNWRDVYPFTATAGTNQWTGAADAAAFYRLKWNP